jgi:FKBP-type peptidyl-prolyl cis-trans isomerase FkpA
MPSLMSRFLSACSLAFVVLAAACTSPTSPTVRTDFTSNDLRVGTGAAAAAGQTLMVNYTGWLYDDTKTDKKGEKFDASTPGQPFVFKLGTGQVIQGWDEGLVGMKIGGLRKLTIPSGKAYGRTGVGSTIPPNATLVFEIELLNLVAG